MFGYDPYIVFGRFRIRSSTAVWELRKATTRGSIHGPAVQFVNAKRFQNRIDDLSIIESARPDTEAAASSGGVLSRVTRLVRG